MTEPWPRAPDGWSYSALVDAEACARRWSLRAQRGARARALTDERARWANARGRAAHAAVERLIGIHQEHQGPAAGSPEIEAFWRAHLPSGLRALVREALYAEAKRRAPSDEARARRWVDEELRATVAIVGAFVRVALAPLDRSVGAVRVDAEVVVSATLAAGPCGVWTGQIDAVSRTREAAVIIDFKTGHRDPTHLEQVRIYDVLFANDVRVSAGARVVKLAVVYGDGSIDTGDPGGRDERAALGEQLVVRAARAAASIEARPPHARPTAELCRACEVRAGCDAYWSARSSWAPARAVETWDGEVVVGRRSPATGALELRCDDGVTAVLLLEDRFATQCASLQTGDQLRIVGARRRSLDDDLETWIIEATTGTVLVKT